MLQQFDSKFDKQHKELVLIGIEITRILDRTKKLQETTDESSSKLEEQEKKFSSIITFFELRLENMSVSKRFGKTFDADQLKIETKIAKNISDINMSPPYGGTIQAMFDLYDQIFESMCTPSDRRSDKQHIILKQFREKNRSESYKHLIPNIQEMFSKSGAILEQQHQ